MSISEELSEITARAIAEKKREKTREKALRLARQKAEIERLHKEKEEAKQIKQFNIKTEKFLSSIRSELFHTAWNGGDSILKQNLYVWEIDVLKNNGYSLSSNESECQQLTQIVTKDLPNKIDALFKDVKDSANKFDIFKNNLLLQQSTQLRQVESSSLKRSIKVIGDAFHSASLAYKSEVEYKTKYESQYLLELARLAPKLKYIKKNIDQIDSKYFEKLSSLGLITIDQQDPNSLDKMRRKKIIIRKVLEEFSEGSWSELSDSEISLTFLAVRNGSSLEEAASTLRKSDNSKGSYDDDRVVNLLADFADKTSDNRVFERFNKRIFLQIAFIENLLSKAAELASDLDLSEDPLLNPSVSKGYVICVSKKYSDFDTFEFLSSNQCKAVRSNLEQQMRASAKKGLKSLSISVKEFEDGIEVKTNGMKSVFLPLSFDLFLDLISSDGLGYEVIEEVDFKFKLSLIWN